MTTPPPDKPADFTASDILSADAWTGRAAKPFVGIDVVCTKIAVDFQNLRRDSLEDCIRRNLELLRGATGSDCAFLAALSPEDGSIAEVQLARSAFAQCRPEGLAGLPCTRSVTMSAEPMCSSANFAPSAAWSLRGELLSRSSERRR